MLYVIKSRDRNFVIRALFRADRLRHFLIAEQPIVVLISDHVRATLGVCNCVR
jgi:hypothetical protein